MAKSKHPKKHPALKIAQKLLENEGYQSEFIAAHSEEELDFDSLLITLDDSEEYVLQAFFMEDMMKAQDPDIPPEETPDFATLQFMLELPFTWEKLDDANMLVVYRVLNDATEHLPIGQFRIEEESIFYQYSLLSETQKVSKTVLTAAVSLMGFFIPTMDAVLQGVISGRLDYHEALQELERRALEQ